MVVKAGTVSFAGVGLAALLAILLNLILPEVQSEEAPAE